MAWFPANTSLAAASAVRLIGRLARFRAREIAEGARMKQPSREPRSPAGSPAAVFTAATKAT